MVEKVICSPEILDVGRVLDQEFNEWVLGYQTFYRRRRLVNFIDKHTITFSLQTVTSDSFFCDPYLHMCIFLIDVPNNSSSHVIVYPEASYDNVNFARLRKDNQSAGNWLNSSSTIDNESVNGKVYFPYLRFRLEQSNPQAGRENVVSIYVNFSS